jgi:hypothetical protein
MKVWQIDAVCTANGRRPMQAHLAEQIQLSEGIFA